jgi:hypothetical protein
MITALATSTQQDDGKGGRGGLEAGDSDSDKGAEVARRRGGGGA